MSAGLCRGALSADGYIIERIPDFIAWLAQVGSAQYAVGQQSARAGGIALLLNGKPLISIAAVLGALELPPAQAAEDEPASAAVSPAACIDTGAPYMHS